MNDDSLTNFGLVIAYILPGYTALWGIALLVPSVPGLFGLLASFRNLSIGGFLFSSLAAIGVGMTVSTVRWLLIDTVHHATGIKQPKWNFANLGNRVSAFETLIDVHYKYYQFNANMLVSTIWVYGVWRYLHPFGLGALDAGCLLVAIVFYLGSRDNLRKYYSRSGQLLGDDVIENQ